MIRFDQDVNNGGVIPAPGPAISPREMEELRRKRQSVNASQRERFPVDPPDGPPRRYMSRDGAGNPKLFRVYPTMRNDKGQSASSSSHMGDPTAPSSSPPGSPEGDLHTAFRAMEGRKGSNLAWAIELVVQHPFFTANVELQKEIMWRCTEYGDGRCWTLERAQRLSAVIEDLNLQDPQFEFPLMDKFVGLIPTHSQGTETKFRFGDPTSPSSWEGNTAHIESKSRDYAPVFSGQVPSGEQPSSRSIAKKN